MSLLKKTVFLLCLIIFAFSNAGSAQKIVNVANGWAKNSVNTVVFRKNAITSFKDVQFISFYDDSGYVVLGKRAINSERWVIKKTQFKGNAADAHCSISIALDGNGYLHMSWGHHNTKLRYATSTQRFSLDMSEEKEMTGIHEAKVSYPEFYRMPNGELLFLYRDGSSGNGSLVINRYNLKTRQWKQIQQNLIDGEGKRNAYWQSCIDKKGIIHISWVWRESPDVASNHDICYARSKDGGITWERSDGKKYQLPVTASNAEYALNIPMNSELINQTSMTVNENGDVLIASYWRDSKQDVPQYHLVIHKNSKWELQNLKLRKSDFSLSGTGTKRIPMSRPQIISWKEGGKWAAALMFRDEERNNYISLAINKDIAKTQWNTIDIYPQPCGSYEPLYDIDLWTSSKKLHLFVQKSDQVDAEGSSTMEPQMVKVLECSFQ